MYEDRIRHHWHTFCELGQTVVLEVEAGKLNETVMDECRTKLESTLAQSGLRENGQPQATPQPKDDPAAALMKQQASMDLERKRQANVANAFRQRDAANLRKINALKTSTDHQPSKGNANHHHKKQNQSYVVDGKLKKNNGQWTKRW